VFSTPKEDFVKTTKTSNFLLLRLLAANVIFFESPFKHAIGFGEMFYGYNGPLSPVIASLVTFCLSPLTSQACLFLHGGGNFDIVSFKTML